MLLISNDITVWKSNRRRIIVIMANECGDSSDSDECDDSSDSGSESDD